jgi:2-dehydropantoate 2-reductase
LFYEKLFGSTPKLFFALLKENYAILRHAGLALERIGLFHPDTVMRILQTPLLPKTMGSFFRPSLQGHIVP